MYRTLFDAFAAGGEITPPSIAHTMRLSGLASTDDAADAIAKRCVAAAGGQGAPIGYEQFCRGLNEALASPDTLLDMAESVNSELSMVQMNRGFAELVTIADTD